VSLLGAGLQRKLQRIAATISAARHLHAPCHPGTMRSHRQRSQQPTEKATQLQNACCLIPSKLTVLHLLVESSRHVDALMNSYGNEDRNWKSAARLLNHLVRAQQHRLRTGKPERVRGFDVQRQLEHGRPLDWEIGRPRTLENLVDVD